MKNWTLEREVVEASKMASKGPEAALKASVMKWYRNTEREYLNLFDGWDTCALCQISLGCWMCVADVDYECCGLWDSIHYRSKRFAVDVMDFLAMKYVEVYRKSLKVGPWTYYLK